MLESGYSQRDGACRCIRIARATRFATRDGLTVSADSVSRQASNRRGIRWTHDDSSAVPANHIAVDDVSNTSEVETEGVAGERVPDDVVSIAPIDLQAIRITLEAIT